MLTKAHGQAAGHKCALLQRLVVVSTHDERIFHNATLVDQRPQPNHRVINLGSSSAAALKSDGVSLGGLTVQSTNFVSTPLISTYMRL